MKHYPLILIFASLFSTVSLSQDAKPEESKGTGFFGFKQGDSAPVSGSATDKGGASKNATKTLEKCEKPLGTIAVVQPQDFMMQALNKYGLPAPSNLLRLMIQQSKCFQVVERGIGMQNMMQERNLAQGGQLQQNSNVGGSQMVTADFLMTPEVNFSEGKSGGAATMGALGSLFGPIGLVAGAISSNLKFQQASTTLLVSDARSGVQVAAASGSAEKTDFQVGGILGAAGLGAYGNTPEGQVVAAAMLNNYNEIVLAIRELKTLVSPTPTAAASENAASSVKATNASNPVAPAFNAGDVLLPKIAGIKVFAKSNTTAKLVFAMKKDDEVIYMGEEQDGYLKVQGANGEGWVDKKMIKK
jgi:hypothetical protein